MDTIRNILKPGAKKDDDTLYASGSQDPNVGKVSGEGTHFPQHGHTDSGVGVDSLTSSTSKPGQATSNYPTAGETGASATKTADPAAAAATTTTATSSSHQAEPIAPTSGVTGASATKTAEDWPLKDTSKREQDIHQQQQDVVNTTADGSEPKYAHQITGDLEGPVHDSKILNDLDPRVKAHPGSATTGGHHRAPKVGETHHEGHAGRDVAIGAGAGAAAGSAAQHHHERQQQEAQHITPQAAESHPHTGHHSHRHDEKLASIHQQQQDVVNTRADGSNPRYAHEIPGDLEGPVHKSKILNDLDPRVKAHPGSATTGGHHRAPKVGETHHDHAARDVAAGAGAGAVGGAAAHEGEKFYDASQGPTGTSVTSSQPTTTSGPGVEYRTLDPKADSSFAHQTVTTEPPTAPAGAPDFQAQQSTSSNAQQTTTGTAPAAATSVVASNQQYQPTTTHPDPTVAADEPKQQEQHHYGRDAAVAGGAIGAGAVAGHEMSKRESEKRVEEQKEREKEAEKLEKQHEKEQREAEKEAEKQQKQHEKEVEKEQKQHEKEVEKEQKQAEKEAEKEQKQHQKEIEKEQKKAEKEHAAVLKQHEKDQKKAEKEAEKENKEAEKQADKERKQAEKEAKKAEKEEKPGLISRLLHRNKDEDAEHEKHMHEAEGVAAGAGAGAGAAALAHHHKETAGTDGLPTTATDPAVQRSVDTTGGADTSATTAGTATGTAAPSEIPARKSSIRNKLTKEPPAGYADSPQTGYASQVTGGTGTTALAQGSQYVPPPSAEATSSASGAPITTTGGIVPGTRYGSGHDEHADHFHGNDPSQGVKSVPTSTAGGTVASEVPLKPAPQEGYASQVTGGTGTTQLAEGQREPITNPRKDDPLHEGPTGFASEVTGGTGTTTLAQGSQSVPTDIPGEIPGVKSETPYEPAPTKGYAAQVTGGTGTTELARGDEDPATHPRNTTLSDKIKSALLLD